MRIEVTDTDSQVDLAREAVASPAPGDSTKLIGPRLTSEQVWDAVGGASFAILGYITPAGEPRSSGVVYKTVGRRLYAVVAPDSWKARDIAATGKVSVTVPIRRGGVLSLVLPIPPATVSFHATAKVQPPGSDQARSLLKALAPMLPPERRNAGAIIEVIPDGAFLTYGLGVSLSQMRNPAAASSRVQVLSPSDGLGQ